MIRKVSDDLRKLALAIAEQQGESLEPKEVAKAIEDALRIVQQQQKSGKPVTAAEVEALAGSGLAKAIAMALLMGIGSLAKAGTPADTTGVGDAISKASDSLTTVRVDVKGILPGTKVSNISGLKVIINTNAQDQGFKILNQLDKDLGTKGFDKEARQGIIKPMLQAMGMLG